MKPRNARERHVVELSEKLPPLTTAQKAYAFEHCFKHEAIARSRSAITFTCLDCGHTFEVENRTADNIKKATCPHCGHKLEVVISKRVRTLADKQTFQIITTIGEWQVIRTYWVAKYTKPSEPCAVTINDGVRRFMRPNEEDVVIARARMPLSYYVDALNFDSDLSIKQDFYGSAYNLWASVVYPRQQVLPTLKRNWYGTKAKQCKFSEVFHKLLENPKYETIAKMERFDV